MKITKILPKMAIILPKKVIILPKKAVLAARTAEDARNPVKPCDTPDTLWNPVRHPESSTSEASELPEERVVCKHDRAESVGWNTYGDKGGPGDCDQTA